MVRTQIQLSEEQARRAKERARKKGVSMAEIIRQALDQALADESGEASIRSRALSVVGCVNSGLGDVAENHDDYLTDAFQE